MTFCEMQQNSVNICPKFPPAIQNVPQACLQCLRVLETPLIDRTFYVCMGVRPMVPPVEWIFLVEDHIYFAKLNERK